MSYFSFLGPQDAMARPMDEGGGGFSPPTPQNDLKGKVKKHHADIESGFGEALKVLRSSPVVHPSSDPEGQAMNPSSDYYDLQRVLETIEKRGSKDIGDADNPIKLADDLRVIAARQSIPPEYAKQLFSAADKLTNAYKASGELEALRKPGQPLAVTPKEVAGRKEYLTSEIQKREDQLKTSGQLRSPQLQEEMKRLREEEGRVALVTQNPEFGPPDPPDFNSTLTGAGMNREQFLGYAASMLEKVQLPNAPIHPGAFGFTLRSVLSSMDQSGDAIAKGFVDAAKPQGGDFQRPETGKPQEQAPGRPGAEQQQQQQDPYQQPIEQRTNEMRNAVNELRNLKTFDSTWKVVLFAIFSVVIGPGPAALLFTNKAKRGELKAELDQMEKDLDNMIRQQDQRKRLQETARHHAVMEDMSQKRFEHDVYKDEEYLKLRRETPRGKDLVADQLLGSYRMWKDEVDEAEKVLNAQFTFNDAEMKKARAKRDKAVPQLEAVRGMILKYRQQKLAETQGK